MALGRTNSGAGNGGRPKFTYTGTYTLLDDGNKNWRIKFLTSGTFTPKQDISIDIFCVGGGAHGTSGDQYESGYGGGGGYARTYIGVVLEKNVAYTVVVGAGGGGKSYFAIESQYFANGGSSQNGGSGGGARANSSNDGGAGGSNGGNGGSSYGAGGTGQGTTTREFGEAAGVLYSGGGGGGW